MRPRLLTLVLFLVAPAGLLVWWGWERRAAATDRAAPQLLTTEVERGDVIRRIVATGKVNPVRSVQVGSQISGMIVELSADFNSEVRKGEVVARLDTATYEANVRLAEAELDSAEADAELSTVHAERIRRLHGDAMVTAAEFEEAQAALRQARAAVRIRREHLERARLELARCRIVSPTDGIVISRNVDVGQVVAASLSAPILFEIAEDLTRMLINARVSEADIGMVRKGQQVEFKMDAYRDVVRLGRVVQIRKAPIMVDNVVSYDTVIDVDNTDLALQPGMTAEVAIITDERRDVVRVRNLALRARLPERLTPPSPSDLPEGSRVVYRLAHPDGPPALEAVVVRVGLADLQHTEILDGLEPGEVVGIGLAPRRARSETGGGSLFRGSQARY